MARRIGVDQRYFTPDYGGEPDLIAVVQQAMAAMTGLGATLVPTDTGDPFAYFDAEFTVLLYEFKVDIADYLATLGHTSMRTLADLIAFNLPHCPTEMKYFGQELFEIAESTSGDLTDPDLSRRAGAFAANRRARTASTRRSRRDDLDAIIAPSYSFASTPAAVAGYPNISIPVGLTPEGKPAGIWMYSGFLREPRLLALAYDLEQELQPRASRRCSARCRPSRRMPDLRRPAAPQIGGKAHLPHHIGTGKPFRF